MAMLGAAAAAFDELAYLAPFVAAAFWAARSVAAGLPARTALGIAAIRRWAALTAGFAAIFIPARFAVAQSCAADYVCNDGWILILGPDAIGAAVARLGSALPLAGWIANSDRADAAGLDLGFAAVLANSMLHRRTAGPACTCTHSSTARTRPSRPERHLEPCHERHH